MLYDQHTYYLILKRKGKGYEALYNIGGEGSTATALRLGGKSAEKIFTDVIESLARQGAVVPLRVSSDEQVYGVREDLGPIVGSYFILVRRARNIEKWSKFFRSLLDGNYIGVAKAFSAFLEIAIELSRTSQAKTSASSFTLSPIVVDALSSALKQFADKIIRA